MQQHACMTLLSMRTVSIAVFAFVALAMADPMAHAGGTGDQQIRTNVAAGVPDYTISITATNGADGPFTVGEPVNGLFVGSGGAGGPYTFGYAYAFPWPEGLSLKSSGAFTGAPARAGPYLFAIFAYDRIGNSSEAKAFAGTVSNAVPTMPEWSLLILLIALGAIGARALSARV
jgi:hypothetical protein